MGFLEFIQTTETKRASPHPASKGYKKIKLLEVNTSFIYHAKLVQKGPLVKVLKKCGKSYCAINVSPME
jgi:hypothetical protein